MIKKTKLEEERTKKIEARRQAEDDKKRRAEEDKKRRAEEMEENANRKRTRSDGENNNPEAESPGVIDPKVHEVVGDADLLTQGDLKIIESFLKGKYSMSPFLNTHPEEIHEEVYEIKLTDRIIQDAQGQPRREVILLLLDYSKCKWRKVKKTMAVAVQPNPTE